MRRFALIGAAGYIAPRHVRALTELGGELRSACDTSDSVGFLDRYAPECRFHTVPAQFFDDLEDVDAVVVCTPNHLHPVHALAALEAGCDVVLEKPLAVSATGLRSAEHLIAHARDYEGTIYPIVQLRHHPQIREVREHVRRTRDFFHCEIDYATYRGPWYQASWKSRKDESGGLLVNLGVHLFDLCCFCFGPFLHSVKATLGPIEATGTFRCERATVSWRLSTRDRETRRVFRVAGRELDLSNQMTELHQVAYRAILAEHAWDLADVSQALYAIAAIERGAEHAETKL